MIQICRGWCRLIKLSLRGSVRRRKEIDGSISEEGTWTQESMKKGEIREHNMFPKGNMTRNMEPIRERISTTKTFMFGSVAKKTT